MTRTLAFILIGLPLGCSSVFVDSESGGTGGSGVSSNSTATSTSTGGSGASSNSTATSASTGGSGASSNSTATSSGTSGTGGPTEDCLNHTDDDGDGAVDCADSDCNAGYSCTPAAPIGWNNGYVLLFVGTPGQEPSCPAEFPTSGPYIGINGISFTASTCASCTCDSPVGQTCDLPDEITLSDKPCGMTPTVPRVLPMPVSWDGSCYGVSGYPGDLSCGGPCNVSVSAPAPTVSGGSCAPHGGAPTLDPVTWNVSAKGCGNAPLGGGCSAAEVCQPHSPGTPFLTGLCVFKEGDHTCPSGPFTDKYLFYNHVTDTRSCTACQCGTPSGSTCNASITLFSDLAPNVCNTSALTFNAGDCGNLTGNPTVVGRSATSAPPSGGSCPASGGQPIGTVTGLMPTTFCCLP